MTDATAVKVSRATQDCLSRCYVSSVPLATLAVYVGELRADPAWQEADIDLVEHSVLRVLSQVVSQPPLRSNVTELEPV